MADDITILRNGLRMLMRDQHEMLRGAVRGLDADGLNWKPGADTNSITQLAGHALEAQRFLVATAMNVEMTRQREAQFMIIAERADDVLAIIDQIENELDGVLNHVTAAQLSADVTRTITTGTATRTGFHWLLHAFAHTREHIGQALLTRQLYEQRGR